MADVPQPPAPRARLPVDPRRLFQFVLGLAGAALVVTGIAQLSEPLLGVILIGLGVLAILLAAYGGPIKRVRWRHFRVEMRRPPDDDD